MSGTHVIGVADEIVSTRNDRRLLTTAGGWVRNGDRLQVTGRHGDGALAVSHRGRTRPRHSPREYVAEHVALAYALTVHEAKASPSTGP